MIFTRTRKTLRSISMKPARLVSYISFALIILAWPLPLFLNNAKFQLFDIPFVYLYTILIGPALILFVTNWACKFSDDLDRRQPETEND